MVTESSGVGHLYAKSEISIALSADIHPTAAIGCGIIIDHATGIVISETAVVKNNVSILQSVTLGYTGKTSGARRPKIREGVMISAEAKILGNIEVGKGAKVGAGSIVLTKLYRCITTTAGVQARIVSRPENEIPSMDMDQYFNNASRSFENDDSI